MKKLNFEEACKLFTRKDAVLVNENSEPINSWPQFFLAAQYYLASSEISTLKNLLV